MNIESIVDQTHRGLLQQKQNQMQKDKQAQQ